MLNYIVEKFISNKSKITEWIQELEKEYPPLLYFSTDIRDSNLKVSIVDGNMFPSGFNNLDTTAIQYASHYLKRHIHRLGIQPIQKSRKNIKTIFFIESNTRNPYYLENCRTIINILQNADIDVICVAEIIESNNLKEIWHTANGNSILVYNMHCLKKSHTKSFKNIDCIIANNDLVNGIPDFFQSLSIPIIPPLEAGWHSRRKSTHFALYQNLLNELASTINIDPWLISAKYSLLKKIDITQKKNQEIIYQNAVELFTDIQEKYKEYKYQEKPFLFLKSDYGTYGMGILNAESPEDFLQMNRKKRNKLYKGKGSIPVICYMLQEGVSTKYNINNNAAEVCMYHTDNEYIGGFFRINNAKNQRENLNSIGSTFMPINYSHKSSLKIDENTIYVYHVLSRILAIASKKEVEQLLKGIYNELCVLDRSYR